MSQEIEHSLKKLRIHYAKNVEIHGIYRPLTLDYLLFSSTTNNLIVKITDDTLNIDQLQEMSSAVVAANSDLLVVDILDLPHVKELLEKAIKKSEGQNRHYSPWNRYISPSVFKNVTGYDNIRIPLDN